MKILEDIPISEKNLDLFHRENLVELVVNYLIDSINNNHACRCIAVYGKWGEGKTSFLNLIKEKLLEQPKDSIIKNKFQIYDFNPWIASNEETLIWDFFNTISKDKTKEIKEKLQKYSGLVNVGTQVIETTASAAMGISPMAFFVGGALKKISKIIKGSWDKSKEVLETINDKTLSERKTAITEDLNKKENHQIIFIDDIDRLDKDETHTIFRLIRQVADFDNTVYIIAMDPDIVSKSLGEYFGEGNIIDGRNFIDKIVQVPIQLPPINNDLFRKNIENKLKIVLSKDLNPGNQKDFEELCEKLSFIFETERQVKKFVNQLNFILPTLKDEVNLFTLCKLEAIKCIDVQAYLQIYYNKEVLRKNGIGTNEQVDKKYEETLNNIVENFPTTRDHIRSLIEDLFTSSLYDEQSDFDNKSLSTDIYFTRYFQLMIPEKVISDQEANKLFDGFDSISIQILSNQINTWIESYDLQEILRILLQILRKEQNETKQKEMSEKITQALVNSKLIQKEGNHFRLDVGNLLIFICHDLIYSHINIIRNENGSISTDEEKVNEILTYIFENPKVPIEICIDINYLIHNQLNLKDKSYISSITRRMPELSAKRFENYDRKQIFPTLWEWKNSEIEGPSNYLKEKLNNPNFDAKKFLGNYISTIHNPNEVRQFIQLFRESSKTLCELLRRNGVPDEDCPQINYILSVYDRVKTNEKC